LSGSEGFAETAAVYNALQGMGYTPDQVDAASTLSVQKILLETTARRIPHPGQQWPSSVRLTTIGAYRVKSLVSTFPYLDAVVVDTAILDSTVRARLHDVSEISERLARAILFVDYLDRCWRDVRSNASSFDWPARSQEARSAIASIQQRRVSRS
jgi:hypothetical protein